jgi:hypothetical protein
MNPFPRGAIKTLSQPPSIYYLELLKYLDPLNWSRSTAGDLRLTFKDLQNLHCLRLTHTTGFASRVRHWSV